MNVKCYIIEDAIHLDRGMDAWCADFKDAIGRCWSDLEKRAYWPAMWPTLSEISLEISAAPPAELAEISKSERDALAPLAKRIASRSNVVLLDLTLNEGESKRALAWGAAQARGAAIADKRLATVSGFRMLEALSKLVPVIVMTAAQNPSVTQYALRQGAIAVIPKPTTDDREISASFVNYDPTRGGAIHAWITAVGRALLTATCLVALEYAIAHAPRNVSAWSVLSREALEPKNLSGTQLLLLDVRGFSQIVHRCAEHNLPRIIFELMHIIWKEVAAELDRHGFEVNNYIGDAVLAMAGVYSQQAAEDAGLKCALALREKFALCGTVRGALQEYLNTQWGDMLQTGAREDMLELIGTVNFGARIVIAAPDAAEAFYGYVGPHHRRQHTVLSRFMNALARAEAAAGSWEKHGGPLHASKEPAACYVLWRKTKEAALLGMAERLLCECQPPDVYLQQTELLIRDVPEEMNVWRLVPQRTAQ